MNIYLSAFVAVLVVWHFAFLYAAWARRNDIVDVLWGPSFLLACAGGLIGEKLCDRPVDLGIVEYAVLGFLSLWGLRLGYHIGQRFIGKSSEDVRYNNWRKQWGKTWLWRSYLQVFILQPVILMMIVMALLNALSLAPRALTFGVAFGALVFIFGFIFEAVGDEQLRRFMKNPSNKGRIMDQGLWAWSRHPNYFGEVVQWWGLWLMCVSSVEDWWTILSPLTITFLILKVSGVSMLEELMMKRPGFKEYGERTSVFFPRPPKR